MRWILLFSLFVSTYVGFAQDKSTAPAKIPEFGEFVSYFDDFVLTSADLPKAGQFIFIFYDPECGHCQELGTEVNKHIKYLKDTKIYFISMQEKPLVGKYRDKYTPSLKNNNNVYFLEDKEYEFIMKFDPQNFPSLYLYDGKTREIKVYLDGQNKMEEVLSYYKNHVE